MGHIPAGQDAPCDRCREGGRAAFSEPIAFAFQPIWDVEAGAVFAQEALLRQTDGSGPGPLFAGLIEDQLYSFDQRCRTTAIAEAAQAGLTGPLSINFYPNAVYEPNRCIQAALSAARRHGLRSCDLIFEVLETEKVADPARLRAIVDCYQDLGFRVALDDFGAGFAGLNLLLDLCPDIVKLDGAVCRDLDADPRRRAVVRGMVAICADLGVELVAEGLETPQAVRAAQDLGIRLVQGFAIARPVFRGLADAQEIAARLSAA